MHRVIILVVICLLTACGASVTSTANYVVLEEINLPKELKETSGLYCPELGSAYTVNDSGNDPIIYHIDNLGRIIGKNALLTKNTDWEALTGDSQHYYIGDIGNNNGKRKFVQIHTVPKQGINSSNIESATNVTTSKIRYTKNAIEKNKYIDHDFDAEALIYLDDSLYLFSKSWRSGTLFIYQLNKLEAKQLVEHVSEVEGLPGVVTGGDFDKKTNRFILVGYELKEMGRFAPFIAILSEDLSLHSVFELKGYGQVEGLCVTSNGQIWFTQESSLFSPHKIVKLDLVE